LHQVAHNHLVLEVHRKNGPELWLFEEVLIVMQVDARLSPDPLHDLETLEVSPIEMLADVVEER
jgi:hypothetical protein